MVSGLAKAIDPIGTSIKFGEYLQHFSMGFMSDLTLALAWALALGEFGIGVNVLFGRNRRVFVNVALLVMLFFTPLTLYLALVNPVDDCGCFGDAVVLTNWQTFAKNCALLLALLWIVFNRYRVVPVLSMSVYTFYFYGVMIVAAALAFIGTWQLPYIDFRPYRPGTSLCHDLSAADDAYGDPAVDGGQAADVTYRIVYERNGERREFDLSSLPEEDSGWQFVETIEVNASQAPVISFGRREEADLQLFDEGHVNITSSVLCDTGYVFLLLSPDLMKAAEHDVDRIESIYEYSMQEGHAFYCVTIRDSEAIDRWRFRTGAEYPMIFADQQVIETMIRSNPGLMLVHNGIILWKSQLSGVNAQALTSAKLSEQSYGQILPISRKKRLFWVIFWLFAPLLLYLPMQFIKKTNNK